MSTRVLKWPHWDTEMDAWSRTKSMVPSSIRWGILKSSFGKVVTNLQHYGLRPDDVFIAAYPKSGSTWLRFMLFQMAFGCPGGFAEVDRSIPIVGRHGRAKRSSHGRFIMTHEPHRAEYERAVYLIRDPRDVLLSEFNYWKWIGTLPPQARVDSFLDIFLAGESNRHGSWQANVSTWLQACRQRRSILIVKFEDLRADPAKALARVCGFLSLNYNPEAITSAVSSNSLAAMQQRERGAVGHFGKVNSEGTFVRSGKIGGWREQLRPDDIVRIEAHLGGLLQQFGYERACVEQA